MLRRSFPICVLKALERRMSYLNTRGGGAAEAEAMMILISGTFICNYNRALTGRINGNIISSIANLAKS